MSCTIQNSGNISIPSSLLHSEEKHLCNLGLINPVVLNELLQQLECLRVVKLSESHFSGPILSLVAKKGLIKTETGPSSTAWPSVGKDTSLYASHDGLYNFSAVSAALAISSQNDPFLDNILNGDKARTAASTSNLMRKKNESALSMISLNHRLILALPFDSICNWIGLQFFTCCKLHRLQIG